MKIEFGISLFFVAALAACGGGSSTAPSVDLESYNGLVSYEKALLNKYYTSSNGLKPTVTATANVPVSGTATYNGVAAFAEGRSTSYNSDNGFSRSASDLNAKVKLDANFADKSLTGKIDGFRNNKNEAVAGSIVLTGGKINGNRFSNSSSAGVSGNVAFDGTDREVTGGLYGGSFIGDSAQGVDGSLLIFRKTESGGTTSQNGTFIAEKK